MNVLALESVPLSLEELASRAFPTGTFTTAQITVNKIQFILRLPFNLWKTCICRSNEASTF